MFFRHGFFTSPRIRTICSAKAFTLIELLILIAILLLLACVLLPALAYQRRHARARACVDNLKQIGVAYRTLTLDGPDSYPAEVDVKFGGAREEVAMGHVFFNFLVMSNELSAPKILVCPDDNEKTVAKNFHSGFNNSNVSYFVGAEARDTFPQMFLSGDRNLAFENKPLLPGIFVWTSNRSALSWTKAIHNECGNVGLADGSVQVLNSRRLAEAAANQSCETNGLVIP
jgi:type II secretory pathway pseudopilin PulG